MSDSAIPKAKPRGAPAADLGGGDRPMWVKFLIRTASALGLAALLGLFVYLGRLYLAGFWYAVCALVYYEVLLTARRHCGSVGRGRMALAWAIYLGVAAYNLDPEVYALAGRAGCAPAVRLGAFLLVTAALTLYAFGAAAGERGAVTFLLWVCFGCVATQGLLSVYVSAILNSRALFLIPLATVICNDVAAYLWGITLGRHRLIRVSPSKTVEGFLGAAVTTTALMPFLAPAIARCFPEGALPPRAMTAYSVCLALWVSLIGPTGGFLASMAKRALGIKDFSNLIPGHGGVLDRLDCQIMCALFNRLLLSALA